MIDTYYWPRSLIAAPPLVAGFGLSLVAEAQARTLHKTWNGSLSPHQKYLAYFTMGPLSFVTNVFNTLFEKLFSFLDAYISFPTEISDVRGSASPNPETYRYTSLPPKDSTFRLLKLSKYKGLELECELFQQSLSNDEHTPYEALSYVWGSAELVECIILDGKRFWITDNLHSALQCLRLRDRDRYLWIDAICINQADKEEQSRQVQQMGVIFKHAEKVLFWLGKATSEIMTLMDALEQLRKLNAAHDTGQWTLSDNRCENYRIGLRQLLNRQWFTRVWILQEAANAQEADVCCGTRSIPAEIFALAPSMIELEPPPHCQPILDIMPGSSRSNSWWTQNRDLCTLLRRFKASKATDERDKIYALLGMSSNPSDMQSIDIDYQRPIDRVINEVVTYLLQSTSVFVYEILNLMNSFAKLNTVYLVPVFMQEHATEIIFPDAQSGHMLGKGREAEYVSQGIRVIKDPALFLIEKRLERNFKDQETCYSQVVKLMLDTQAMKAPEHQIYDDGLQVISWGSVEQHVKIVVIHDIKKAMLKAALRGCDRIVKKLLRKDIRGYVEEKWEYSALKEAIENGYIRAGEMILRQDIHMNAQDGKYGNALCTAANKSNERMVRLLLDAGVDVNAQGEHFGTALQAAAGNIYKGKEQIIEVLLKKMPTLMLKVENMATHSRWLRTDVVKR